MISDDFATDRCPFVLVYAYRTAVVD